MKPDAREAGEAYLMAQTAVAQLKSAIHMVLARADSEGLRNIDIGRLLGIYKGHAAHEGHIPRTLLAIMEDEGVVEQDSETKRWMLRQLADTESPEAGAGGQPA